MDEKLVCILNEMADFLSIAQTKKLQEVLLKNLSSEAPQREQTSNETYLNSVCSLSNLFFRFHTTTLTEACSNELKQHHL